MLTCQIKTMAAIVDNKIAGIFIDFKIGFTLKTKIIF
jgi:hypothetical protein